jgi:hypothetical protein
MEEKRPVYIQYIQRDSKDLAITYFSVAFPSKDQDQAGVPNRQDQWGISWVRISSSICLVFSKISDGWISLQDDGPLGIFLDNLLEEWKIVLSKIRKEIDDLVSY